MEIPLNGSTNDTSLAKILVFLNRGRKTGTLTLKSRNFTKKIYLRDGDAIFASSTNEDDRLGEMLLKADKITVAQYDKSVEVLKATKKRQGAILVDLGYLTPKELFWGVKYQVREIIYSMFMMEDASYTFSEGEIAKDEVITLKMSMGTLIYEGVKRIENWTRIRNEMPDTNSLLKLSEDPLNLFQNIELSPQDKKILALIDGQKTIKQIIDNSWMGSFEALKILYVLLATGIVETKGVAQAGPAKAEKAIAVEEILKPLPEAEGALIKRINDIHGRLGSIKYHELLEIEEGAESDEIKRNYFRLAKEFHPDRYFSIGDETIKAKLTSIFDAVTEAYDVLKDERQRKKYFKTGEAPKPKEKTEDKNRAASQFRAGVSEFKKGNFWGAVENFKWATKLAPGNAGYWNYLSLAYSRIAGRIKDAEDALHEAIKLEPNNADFLANLGLVYLKAGLKKQAKSSFQKALQVDPANEKAKKGLEQTKG